MQMPSDTNDLQLQQHSQAWPKNFLEDSCQTTGAAPWAHQGICRVCSS